MKPSTLTESDRNCSRARALSGETGSIWLWALTLLFAVSWVVTTPTCLNAAQKYYYIHVASFRVKKNAIKVAQGLKEKGFGAVVSGEQVQNKGYWYRIYVGPISSLQQAKLQSSELKKKGLTKYTAIFKKYPIRDDSEKKVGVAKKAAPVGAAAAGTRASRPPKAAPAVSKKPPTVQPRPQKVEVEKKPPTTVTPAEERQKIAYQKPEPAARAVKEPAKETKELQRRGDGQNIAAGKFSLSLGQTYREVKTDLTDRTLITTNGTTTVQPVPISSGEKNDFDTEMNLTMLRLGFGITDFLEIFGDIGACYDDFKDFKLAYGGGARANLFEAKSGRLKGLYFALQGEYLRGKLDSDYQSVQGNKFSKESDWWNFTAKGEIGYTINRFAVYAGATYFTYKEDTDRKQQENLPVGLTSVKYKDDLEEENTFGAYGGLNVYLTPGLLLNLEGQVITQNSITAALEYRF